MTTGRAYTRRILPSSPFNVPQPVEAPPEEYAIDDRVNHDRYGMGTVTQVNGTSDVVVDFGGSIRRITLPNPKLGKL